MMLQQPFEADNTWEKHIDPDIDHFFFFIPLSSMINSIAPGLDENGNNKIIR